MMEWIRSFLQSKGGRPGSAVTFMEEFGLATGGQVQGNNGGSSSGYKQKSHDSIEGVRVILYSTR